MSSGKDLSQCTIARLSDSLFFHAGSRLAHPAFSLPTLEQTENNLTYNLTSPGTVWPTHYQPEKGGSKVNRRIPREHEIIRQARIQLGLSQQQVATLISIQIRQYQRLEYGESDVQKLGMRAGLSLCIVLELDPYDLIFGAHPEMVEDLKRRRPAKGNLKKRHKS